MPDGETTEICIEHIGNMKREMQKFSNKNFSNMVKELKELTYAYRRNIILIETVSV